jgi:hypothetical protein
MVDAWAGVLRQVGWPETVVVLDWETYFDADYHMGKGSLSTIEYLMDSRFEELGVASLITPKGQPFKPRQASFWPDVPQFITWLKSVYGDQLEKCTVCMQNARFDSSILAFKYNIRPPYIIDTLGLANHLDARARANLAALCKSLNLPDKGDTKQFSGVHRDMDNSTYDALSDYARNDAEREMDVLALLLPRLTNPKVELPVMRHTLKMFWEPRIVVDEPAVLALRGEMQGELEGLLAGCGHSQEQISGNKSFVELLLAALPNGEVLPMKQGKNGAIPALAKDDEGLEMLRRSASPQVRALIAARSAVRSWPLHMKRLDALVRQSRCLGGRLANPLKYCGAHTGRWSGGEGINTMNLGAR